VNEHGAFSGSPPAWALGPFALKFQTWFVLGTELALGVLVWFEDVRKWVLLAGLAMHAAIECTMTIPLFEWTMVATYVSFLDGAQVRRWVAWVLERGSRAVVVAARRPSERPRQRGEARLRRARARRRASTLAAPTLARGRRGTGKP
jgi:hypothetical protein